MQYFRFYPDCHYVPGPVRGTLYNIGEGKSYHLVQDDAEIMEMLLGHHNVQAVVNRFGQRAALLVDKYVQEGMGALYDTPVYSEDYYPHTVFEVRGLFDTPPVLKAAFIQLTDDCQANCSFCASDAHYRLEGCNSCLRWPNGGGKKLTEGGNLKKTLDLLQQLDVPTVIYSGGNPLLEFDTLATAVAQCLEANPRIKQVVHTNGGGMDTDRAKSLRNMQVEINFTLLATDSIEYAEVTGRPELYNELCAAVDLCKQHKIPYDVIPLVSDGVANRWPQMKELAKELGGKGLFSSELLPKDGTRRKKITGPTGPDKIEDINMEWYFHSKRYSYCLNGMLAVASNGAIMTCPMWPEAEANVISDGGFAKAFRSGGIDKGWKLTNEKIAKCRNCENRYVCLDCALLAWYSNTVPEAHAMYCDYDPQEGVWQRT